MVVWAAVRAALQGRVGLTHAATAVGRARVAFAVASATLVSGAEAASASGTAVHTGNSPVFRESVEGAVDYDFACMGGGTVHFSGSVQASSEPAGGQAMFELSTDFVGCEVMGGKITIDGGMDYAASASSSGDADVTFAMNGSLSFSGDIDGSCDFDVKFSATARVKARPASCTRAPSAGTTRTEPRAQLLGLSARFSPRRASSSARAPTRGRGQLGRICRAGSPSGTPPGLATSSCGPSHLPDLGVTYVDRAVAARFASRACAVPQR